MISNGENWLKIKQESQKYLYSNMQSQEICQILKQILPELEAKIKADLKAEYQQRITEIENYYQKQIDQLVQKQSQLKSQYQSRQTLQQQINNDKDKQQLYKRISILESQRKNWCKLQTQYQATIKQLTDLLLTKSDKFDRSEKYSEPITPISMSNYTSQDFSSVSPIYPPPDSIGSSSQIQKWEKIKPKVNDNLCKPFKKEKKQSKQIVKQHQEQNENNSLSKYIKSQNFSTDQNTRQHYHSVLSPPKQQQTTSRSKKIFWDDNKKKQLLSLIKLN